jgi:hypothetical protein
MAVAGRLDDIPVKQAGKPIHGEMPKYPWAAVKVVTVPAAAAA